ncbi:MAG TPA: Fic family protein [Pyrinomonadaceae bacterium]
MTSTAAVQEQPLNCYQGIPSFVEWRKAGVDVARWNQAMASLNSHGELASDLLRRMRIIIREAARSIAGRNNGRKSQLTLQVQSAMWLAALGEKGEDAQPAIESQLLACDYIIVAALKKRLITEELIRELHVRTCRRQETYKIATAHGLREEAFRSGEYKRFPNHVAPHLERRPAYAPVALTQSEMKKFCEELNTDLFLAAHPVLQASYALYSLLIIHPFADGNGRVARALALLFTYRSNAIPMLALSQEREAYVASLVSAAMGEFQPLVDFVERRAINAISSIESGIRTARAGQPASS